MKSSIRKLSAALSLAILAGCATPVTKPVSVDHVAVDAETKKQREIAFKSMLAAEARLFDVAFPLRVAASPLCPGSQGRGLGLRFANQPSFGKEFQDAAAAVLGADESVRIILIVPGGPADRAGLKAGDLLIAINDRPVPVGAEATKGLNDLVANESKDGKPLRIRIRRDVEQTIEAQPLPVCSYVVSQVNRDEINAVADGSRVYIYKGMLRFAQTDQELALVVSHELAHNVMEHRKAQQKNRSWGMLLDIAALAAGVSTNVFSNLAGQAYSQEFEAEADYVGLYLMARAGMNIDGAADFWRRMAAENPAAIKSSNSGSHPATSERFLAIEKTVAEIRKKQADHQPLDPELKKGKAVSNTRDDNIATDPLHLSP